MRNKLFMHYGPMMSAMSLTHTRNHFLSLTDKHSLSNFPCVSAVSLLQCNPHRPTHPSAPPYNRISIACLAAVCKLVCLWMSMFLTEALQGHCYGNLRMGSSSCVVTEHRSQGSHEKQDKRGTIGGWRMLQCLVL